MNNADLYIGLISGTSVDGVDCALVRFEGNSPQVIGTAFTPTPKDLREQILALCTGQNISLEIYGQVDIAIGRMFANAALELIESKGVAASDVAAIGSHGQTVFHEPDSDLPFSLQLGDPNSIAQLTGITTIADIRRRDMAVGGEGAPLAPLLHRNCLASSEFDRVIVNVGGIANITILRKDGSCLAFDTGPANVLMDHWIEARKGERFDEDGAWAAEGAVDSALLMELMDEPYFSEPYPKSTGRELFNAQWLEERLSRLTRIMQPQDVQRTLLELAAKSITTAIHEHVQPDQVFLCGGGAQNDFLMTRLQTLLQPASVESTASIGIEPDWVEAIAFAWIARETLAGRTIDTTTLTGASQPVILGGIYQG